jgi:hypothetical protein
MTTPCKYHFSYPPPVDALGKRVGALWPQQKAEIFRANTTFYSSGTEKLLSQFSNPSVIAVMIMC